MNPGEIFGTTFIVCLFTEITLGIIGGAVLAWRFMPVIFLVMIVAYFITIAADNANSKAGGI